MGRIVTTVLVAVWLLYIGIMYSSSPILTLAIGILLFLVFSIVDLIIRYFCVQPYVQVPINVVEVGAEVAVYIRVKNKSVFAIAKSRYEVETRNKFLSDSCVHKMYGDILLPGKNEMAFDMVVEEPGNYEVELKNLYLYNMTGTYCIKKRVRRSAHFQANPRFTEIGVSITEATRNFYGEGDTYKDLRPGCDPSETFRIREFRNGDKIQKIHWKLSVKQDDLVIKEDSEPASAPVILFLNYTVPQKKKENHVEAYLGVLGSLSFSLLDKKCYHYVSWYSAVYKDIVRVRIFDEAGFFFMLASYLSDAYVTSPGRLQDLYREKYRGEHYLYELEWNEKLELIKNGKVMKKFTNEFWQKDAEALEIIL